MHHRLAGDADLDHLSDIVVDEGLTALRLRAQDRRSGGSICAMTSYLLLFALSDGTSLDFGPSTRGFIRDVTGIGLMMVDGGPRTGNANVAEHVLVRASR